MKPYVPILTPGTLFRFFPEQQPYASGNFPTPLETPSPFQQQVLVGFLLGDRCLGNPNTRRRATGNYRLEVTFAHKVKPFILWL